MLWINGELVEPQRATVSVMDHGLLYGDGVFEGIRFYQGRPFRLAAHLKRLFASAKALDIKVPYGAVELSDGLMALIEANGLEDGYLRLVVTRGLGDLGVNPYLCEQPQVFMMISPLKMVANPQAGIRMITAHNRKPAHDALATQVKSLNYLNSVMAKAQAVKAKVDDALVLNQNGVIAEASAANVFLMLDECLVTPPISDGCLAGITRAEVLDIAKELGLTANERSLTLFDAYNCEGMFLTGTGAELMQVKELDGRSLAMSAWFEEIQKVFRQRTQALND